MISSYLTYDRLDAALCCNPYLASVSERCNFTAERTEYMTPTEKFKKIDKTYQLSDSSVNEYGFRLLTEGYQLDEFNKNPIGYYMHQRENGVALRWDNLRIDGDAVLAEPVINMANDRGEQTYDEAENGFLNAASVGHIVVLEYSTDPAIMLPGQTGPTITKWYNKECSLVDIPGNCNSLTKLYDIQDNLINLSDLSTNSDILKVKSITMAKQTLEITPELLTLMNLKSDADGEAMKVALTNLKSKADKADQLEEDNKTLKTEKAEAEQKLVELKAEQTKGAVKMHIDAALKANKITAEVGAQLAADYAEKPEALASMLDKMQPYKSIADNLKAGDAPEGEEGWKWDDYQTKDPKGEKLKNLKANNTEQYEAIYKEKFGKAPKK